jgi:energy-coupling factor transporter ATP-binding protein EcfA2
VKIKNFLSFDAREFQIELSDINVFTGPNASGKTNFLRTLWYVGSSINPGYYGPAKKYEDSSHLRPDEEIEIGLSLADDEIDALANYLILSPLAETLRVIDKENQLALQRLAFIITTNLPKKQLQDLFRKVSILIKGGGFPRGSSQVLLKIQLSGTNLYINRNGLSSYPVSNPNGASTQFARMLVDAAHSMEPNIKEDLKTPTYDENGALKFSPHLNYAELFKHVTEEIVSGKFASISLPPAFSLDNIENMGFASNYVKSLREFVQNQGSANQAVDFLSLIGMVYNKTLVGTSDLRVRPEDYVTLPQNLELEARNMKQVDGRKLSIALFYLKNSPFSRDRDRYSQIRESLLNLSGTHVDVVLHRRAADSFQSLPDIPILVTMPNRGFGDNQPPSVRLGSESHIYEVMVVVKDRDTWVPLSSSAAGVFELLVLLTILIGQEDKVLLLDEPALNLHPTKQVQLRKILERSTSTNQVLVVTHSPLLVSMDYSDHTWRFFHDSEGTRAIGLKELGYSQNVRRRIGGAITEEEWGGLLFASGLVVVEGPGDKYATEEFDLKLGRKGAQLKEDNWLVMNPTGKDSIGVLMDISQRIGIPAVVLTDRDGIMECKSRIKYGKAQRPMPNIFSYLVEAGIMSRKDKADLIATPMNANYYASSAFRRVSGLAKRNNIFALTGSLEDALGIKKRRKNNLRVVFDRVRETKTNQVPREFIALFKFVKERKNLAE